MYTNKAMLRTKFGNRNMENTMTLFKDNGRMRRNSVYIAATRHDKTPHDKDKLANNESIVGPILASRAL